MKAHENQPAFQTLSYLIAASVFVAVLLSAVAAAALDFPPLTGRVVDQAGILDPAARNELTDKLAALEQKTTDQFVVVTLKSLQGTTIEDFGVQLGRHWRIGQMGKNNGVLLVVAPNERQVRIEVGYGLEGTLTDAVSKLIIENAIIPRFRAGDFAGGIRRGADDIVQVLGGDAEAFKARAREQSARRTTPFESAIMVVFMLVAGFIVISVIGGILQIFHALLVAFGLAAKKPKDGFWYWVNQMPSGGSGSSSGRSSGGSSGGFSGGGGSFGGGGSSGRW
jgi:uncharacterized protein